MKNKKGFWLFVLGLVILGLGVAALIAAIVFEIIGNKSLYQIMGLIVIIAGPVSILLLILKLVLFGGAASPEPKIPEVKTYQYNKKSIPIVDVKEFKKSQDEIMYEKYVDLYNKKIISKEDLEKKRIELLGK